MINYVSPNWCDLEWTPWIPFTESLRFRDLPDTPGLYRVRVINGQELFYIGQTGRSLRGRLYDLQRNTMQVIMPYNDPHTGAPSLWAWRDAEGFIFECSATSLILTNDPKEARRLREGLESYLLWQYRLAHGSSTRCNHGRFHPRYLKSKDGKTKFRGRRLNDTEPSNPAGGLSLPPLQLLAYPLDQNWMSLSWSTPSTLNASHMRNIPSSPGVYKLFDPDARALLYIGESKNLLERLMTHTHRNWQCSYPHFSYVQLPNDTPAYQRHEIENDLIGGFYAVNKQIPKFQFSNHHR